MFSSASTTPDQLFRDGQIRHGKSPTPSRIGFRDGNCHGCTVMDGMTGKVPFPWRIAITHFSVTVTTDRNRLPRHDGVKRQENFPCRIQDRQGKFKILPSFTYRQGCLKLSVSADCQGSLKLSLSATTTVPSQLIIWWMLPEIWF